MGGFTPKLAETYKKLQASKPGAFEVVDAKTGETITTEGREAVGSDPDGESFPWTPPTFAEALGSDFLKTSPEALVGKKLALYFSAHWCPPSSDSRRSSSRCTTR